MADALEAMGLWPIKEYIQIWQSTIADQVDFCQIYELVTGAEQILGSSKLMRWWDQDVGREEE